MIISTGRKYIFAHIPKTGGTALATALESRAMKDDILIGDTAKAQRRKAKLAGLTAKGRIWKHSTVDDMTGVVNPEGMLVFTLVRNPWDRLVSYYSWLQSQTFAHPAVGLAQCCTFSEFLNHPMTQSAVVATPYKSYVTPNAHFFRLEHLTQDLAPLWDHLGFELTIDHLNQSQRPREWRPFYSNADAELVGKLCAEDIARSHYHFA